MSSIRYSEYEIIQHQKEELEMQNKRMVERISKLQFIYKGNSETRKSDTLTNNYRLWFVTQSPSTDKP